MRESLKLRGDVTVRAHPAAWTYRGADLGSGRVLTSGRNTIQAAGLAYIAQMLMADPVNDPRKYGITQIGISQAGTEEYKADITDQYVSSGAVVSVLYVPANLPAGQPYAIDGATLYLDSGGATALAAKVFTPTFNKTSLVALTVEWTITLTG